MTAEDKGAQPEQAQSPITKETDEGQPIIPPAEITLPEEEGGEATITEQEEGAGELEPAPAATQAEKDKRPKNRIPAKQRINQLWHEARQAETVAEQLRRENEELKAQMATTNTKSAEVNAAALVAHENSWKNARDLARRELVDAKNAGNAEAEANAISKLSRAESELANVEAYRAAQPKPNGAAKAEPEKPKPQGNGQAQPQQQVEVTPEIQSWVERNLWAVNDPRNPQFDPEMANFMANQANILEQRMRRQNRTAEIGTETYFDEIDRLMREEFPDRFDDTEEEEVAEPQPKPQPRQQPANQRRAPAMARQNGAAVAPAAASAGQAVQRAQPRTVNLTAEERSFAHGMAANGALRYPAGHKMQGKPMAPADAEVAYARQKLNQTAGR